MTLREALRHAQSRLAARGIETPQLDASLLLAEALGVPGREQVLSRLPESLDDAAARRFDELLERRARGEPVSYIRGRKEFYSLTFLVGPGVLVPRPDTELLVERALALAAPRARLHDACTGSGCVAVAVSSVRADLEVSASDISAEAAAVFALNCRRLLGRELAFTASDLLAAVPGRFDLITANPPYLRDDEVRALRARGWPEPELALAGGPDGLDPARRLIAEAPPRLEAGGWLLLEADPQQMDDLEGCLLGHGFEAVRRSRDLAGRERVMEARLRAQAGAGTAGGRA
jgi:release factor glutamine methyltransferase